MEIDEIVAALNRNLEKEYASVLLYIQFSGDPRISKDPELPRIISVLAEDEMRHAEKLADTIAEIGGKSSWHLAPFDRKKTLRESIQRIANLEDEAIREYSALIARLGDRPKIQQALEGMLNDERRHKAQTERILKSHEALLGEF